MTEWFPALDGAIGGIGETIRGAGNFLFGGIGNMLSGLWGGTVGAGASWVTGGLVSTAMKFTIVGIVGYIAFKEVN